MLCENSALVHNGIITISYIHKTNTKDLMVTMMHKELVQRTTGQKPFLEFFSRFEPGLSSVLKT